MIEDLLKYYRNLRDRLISDIDTQEEHGSLVEKGQLEIVNNIIADLLMLLEKENDEYEIC